MTLNTSPLSGPVAETQASLFRPLTDTQKDFVTKMDQEVGAGGQLPFYNLFNQYTYLCAQKINALAEKIRVPPATSKRAHFFLTLTTSQIKCWSRQQITDILSESFDSIFALFRLANASNSSEVFTSPFFKTKNILFERGLSGCRHYRDLSNFHFLESQPTFVQAPFLAIIADLYSAYALYTQLSLEESTLGSLARIPRALHPGHPEPKEGISHTQMLTMINYIVQFVVNATQNNLINMEVYKMDEMQKLTANSSNTSKDYYYFVEKTLTSFIQDTTKAKFGLKIQLHQALSGRLSYVDYCHQVGLKPSKEPTEKKFTAQIGVFMSFFHFITSEATLLRRLLQPRFISCFAPKDTPYRYTLHPEMIWLITKNCEYFTSLPSSIEALTLQSKLKLYFLPNQIKSLVKIQEQAKSLSCFYDMEAEVPFFGCYLAFITKLDPKSADYTDVCTHEKLKIQLVETIEKVVEFNDSLNSLLKEIYDHLSTLSILESDKAELVDYLNILSVTLRMLPQNHLNLCQAACALFSDLIFEVEECPIPLISTLDPIDWINDLRTFSPSSPSVRIEPFFSSPKESPSRSPQRNLSSKKILHILKENHFHVVRQTGSHAILKHLEDPTKGATVPVGYDTLAQGTLLNIFKQAGLDPSAC